MIVSKNKRTTAIVLLIIIELVLAVGIAFTNGAVEKHESIKEMMRDAVLHEENKINLFGLAVNPSLVAGFVVTAIILLFALIVRIFVIPRFKNVPGKFQLVLETWVGFFENLAKTNSPHSNGFLGAYIFATGTYVFTGTLFELFGVQVLTTEGHSISLPAPLADINGAIMMGCLSYLVILSGGIKNNKLRGVGLTLKEFSLPLSMSFRLFGALLSGMLVTELIYFTLGLSILLPVVVGVMFTLLHALIQAYVLTLLTAIFYGEVSEPPKPKEKKEKKSNKEKTDGTPAEAMQEA